MMTKKQFCEMLLITLQRKSKIEDAIPKDKQGFWDMVMTSTSSGVCLEYLGYLDDYDDIRDYLSARAGVMHSYLDRKNGQLSMITTREMIEMLPDEINEEDL